MSPFRIALLCAAAIATTRLCFADPTAAKPTALATTPAPLWNPSWRRFHPVEYVTTSAAAAAALYLYFVQASPEEAGWEGGILLDDSARSALGAKSREGRNRAMIASDALYLPPFTWLVSDFFVLGAHPRGGWDAAFQMFLLDAQALSLNGLVTVSLLKTVGRARPSTEDCRADPDYEPLCNKGTYVSFPSGHTSSTAAAAGLVCAHHLHMPLYGGGLPDVLACVAVIASSTAMGTLRMVADRHYLSDVVVGASTGFLLGYGLPSLFHYRAVPTISSRASSFRLGFVPLIGSDAIGLQAVGWQ